MISGAKNHQNNLDDIERTEREALEAMKNKEFPQVPYTHRKYILPKEDNPKIQCYGSAVVSLWIRIWIQLFISTRILIWIQGAVPYT
jgi:hypothetical protein